MPRVTNKGYLHGTMGGTTFYPMYEGTEDEALFVRQKSSLTKKKFYRKPTMERARMNAAEFGRASKLANTMYRCLPKEQKGRKVHQKLIATVKAFMRHEEKTDQEIVLWFEQEFDVVAGWARMNTGLPKVEVDAWGRAVVREGDKQPHVIEVRKAKAESVACEVCVATWIGKKESGERRADSREVNENVILEAPVVVRAKVKVSQKLRKEVLVGWSEKDTAVRKANERKVNGKQWFLKMRGVGDTRPTGWPTKKHERHENMFDERMLV